MSSACRNSNDAVEAHFNELFSCPALARASMTISGAGAAEAWQTIKILELVLKRI
jgi:hypothetical protein